MANDYIINTELPHIESNVPSYDIDSDIKFQLFVQTSQSLIKLNNDYIFRSSDFCINNKFNFHDFVDTLNKKICICHTIYSDIQNIGMAVLFESNYNEIINTILLKYPLIKVRKLLYINFLIDNEHKLTGFEIASKLAGLTVAKIKKDNIYFFDKLYLGDENDEWNTINKKLNSNTPEFDKFVFNQKVRELDKLSKLVVSILFPSRSRHYTQLFDNSFDSSEKKITLEIVSSIKSQNNKRGMSFTIQKKVDAGITRSESNPQSNYDKPKFIVTRKQNEEKKDRKSQLEQFDRHKMYSKQIKKELEEFNKSLSECKKNKDRYMFIEARSAIEHLLKLVIYLDDRFNNIDELLKLTPMDKIKSEIFITYFPNNIITIIGEMIKNGNMAIHEANMFKYTSAELKKERNQLEQLCNWFYFAYPQILDN